ncbi:hypothetical protein Acsp01_76650 [Actinoplanes sp. NBRC 101535]|nr:hypothetical protein Acsp01_76650 [Actinoplanes sp. NBRC 101535]
MSDEREPGRDETRPMSPVNDADATAVDRNQPSGGPRSDDADQRVWTGRAGVRPPRPGTADYDTEPDWADTLPSEPSGRWWAPIAVGTLALLLLGLLVVGVVLIVQNAGGGTESPSPTPTLATTTTGDGAETDPTGTVSTPAPQITTTPTTEPASTEVTVPALRGMPLADAQAALDRTGLRNRVIRIPSDAEPGTVIDSDPAEGRQVPSDTRVTLVVASEQTSEPTTAPTASAASSPSPAG